jgi:hypothetical protein
MHDDIDNDNYDDNGEDDDTFDNDVMMTRKATSETTAMRENDIEDDDGYGLIT